MKLATLAYETIKDAIEFQSGFNFQGFINGDYDADRDFSTQISFAFNYINLAITRLVTEQKTLLKIFKDISSETGYIEFTKGKVISVVSDLSAGYERVLWREFHNGIAVQEPFVRKPVYIEYRPSVPHFDLDSIRKTALNDENDLMFVEEEIELEHFGITVEMCSYIKEFCKGGLLEYLSPDLSRRHTQMAENYFSALKTQLTQFPIREIIDVTKGGGAF